MQLHTEQTEDGLIILLEGRVDSETSLSAHNELEKAVQRTTAPVIISGEKLEYISSAGMRVLLILAKTLHKQSRAMVVCSLRPSIHEIFKISGFDRIMDIYEDQSAAIEAIRA